MAKLSPGETVLNLGSGGSGGSRHIQIGAKIIWQFQSESTYKEACVSEFLFAGEVSLEARAGSGLDVDHWTA